MVTPKDTPNAYDYVIPDPKVIADLLEVMSLEQVLRQRLTFGKAAKRMELLEKLYSAKLLELILTSDYALSESGKPIYRNDDGSVYVDTKLTKTISRSMLVAHGVDADLVTACTEVTESKPFPVTRGKGEKRDPDASSTPA